MSVIDRVGDATLPVQEAAQQRPAGWASWRVRYQASSVVSDAVCSVAVLTALGYWTAESPWLVGFGGGLAFVAGVASARGYESRRAAAGVQEYRAIARGFLAVIVAAMVVGFLGLVTLPVVPTVGAAAAAATGAGLLRTAQRRVVSGKRANGELRSRAVIVGTADHAARVAGDLAATDGRLEVIGACVPGREIGTTLVDGLAVLGSPQDVRAVMETSEAEVVLVAAGALEPDELRRLQWDLARAGADMAIVPELSEVLPGRIDLEFTDTTPLLNVRLQPTVTQRFVKAAMDRLLSVLLLVVAAPVITAGIVATRVTSPGPGIFRQVRIGQDGRPFTMFKIRTMGVDAELRRDALMGSSTGAGPLFKMAADPRITPVGRVLRRFSIDELPQLWNVVRGDMSLVGPRPPLASEVAEYDSMAVHRLHVKPGLTGLWQVSGRSDLTWEQSVRLDLRYVDNWSVGFDLLILWRTAAAVFGARGAY